jgi:hypothetical protein
VAPAEHPGASLFQFFFLAAVFRSTPRQYQEQ